MVKYFENSDKMDTLLKKKKNLTYQNQFQKKKN